MRSPINNIKAIGNLMKKKELIFAGRRHINILY